MTPKMRHVERVEFSATAPTQIVVYMAQLAEAGDGWINLIPKLSDDDEPTTLGFFTLFGGGSTGVTMCTWIPDHHDRRARGHMSLGITHTLGQRAKGRLQSRATPIPATWRIEQDHAKRGLVFQVPLDEPNEQVLAWALRAVGSLTPADQIEKWRAEVYFPAS